ncbi:hypothetical protein M231_05089 [Tremella mesenterica]|uniref:1-phosphatidylinositol 4-kinase n=1 Tax=Tremella mesenterica TaxID=5217 RepID=A0A4V1M3Q4_TREME|nr:hypothetical protein M231_05089 [Tremella mesenterica]
MLEDEINACGRGRVLLASNMTFWFMQAALRDLTPTRTTNPRPFAICQRILHRCHEIIFGDPPEPSRSPYRSLPHSPPASTVALLDSPMNSIMKNKHLDDVRGPPVRVNPHVSPALVGMGALVAGIAMPGLTDMVGKWAVIQGRRPRDDAGESRARVEVDQQGGADVTVETKPAIQKTSVEEDHSSDEEEKTASPSPPRKGQVALIRSESLHGRLPSTAPAISSSFTLPHPASTAPVLYSPPPSKIQTPPFSPMGSPMPPPTDTDPFSQNVPESAGPSRSNTPPRQTHQPFYSVPDFSSSKPHHSALRRLHPSERTPTADTLLATYSLGAQRQLLRSHYCRSEVRFLLILEDISNRLLVVPKPARVSALRAELTSLNHNLPAEVCMPLWCAADHSCEEGGETSTGTPLKARLDRPRNSRKRAHSRVVRISPGDSVVLNSAERAPFLLHVEILEGDLDFDPSRRENRELLKKIVLQADMKRRKKEKEQDSGLVRPTDGFGAPMPEAIRPTPPKIGPRPALRPAPLSAESRKESKIEEVEEMDLVEQLYGAQLSVKDVLPDISESIPLPAAPKNKQLDLAQWDRDRASFPAPPTPSRRTSMNNDPHDQPIMANSLMSSPIINGHLETAQGRSMPTSPNLPSFAEGVSTPRRQLTMEDYSERMRTAAVMLAQLNASQVATMPEGSSGSGKLSWIPGTGWIMGSSNSPHGPANSDTIHGGGVAGAGGKLKLAATQAAAIKDRIMEEMMALEEERVARMTDQTESTGLEGGQSSGGQTAEDEGIVRRELNKADPSAAVFRESWTAKKSRIRASSPWGHLANWDVISVIVKTGTDLRQEQLATQLIERFGKIWKEEKCDCWVRFFRILITGESSGLVETITDAVSVHSIKKGEYARRIAEGRPMGHVSLMDHFVNTYGKPDSGRFARAQRNFIKSLAGYSVVTYLLQIKDRHNGNILVDRDGHLIHIDFGFMLSNSPGGNMGFEAAPFKLPLEYVEIMGGLHSPGYVYFRKLFKEGFEVARKHSDSLITIVELMQKDSKLDCFALFGEQTAHHFRERFALGLTTQAVDAYLERLIVSSTGSNYTRMYDTFQYYSQGVL